MEKLDKRKLKKADLNKRQLAVLRMAAELGKRLQLEIPQIGEDYCSGSFFTELIEQHNIRSRYDVGYNVAKKAIEYCIKGYERGHGVDSYEGLIKESELERISKEHIERRGRETSERFLGVPREVSPEQLERIKESSRKRGKKLYEEGKGLFASTKEQLSVYGRKGGEKSHQMGVGIHGIPLERKKVIGLKVGLITGPLTFQRKTGIHAQSNEERRAAACKARDMGVGVHAMSWEELQEASRKAAIARGQVLWSDEEMRHAYQLSQREEYKIRGKANNLKIANELNEFFHDGKKVRDNSTVSSARKRHLKLLER